MTLRSDAAEIVFEHVTKRYGGSDRPAVDDLSLTIPAGEICVLIGPSGGGKTTAMKLVNRLITLTDGDITIEGTSVMKMDPVELRRGIGYVIQQIGLFPHMTIEANVATVPKLVGWDKARTRERARELLDLVGLDPEEYAKRYPAQLSGGQRQRVGLARAMAADPPLMLMDEPFGAIDPITRERLQNDFLRLHREVRKTVIFVTHDIDEAIKMGDRVCILRQGGKLAQYDTPEAILANPADEFVADFVGADRGLKRLGLRTLGEVDVLASSPSTNGDRRPEAGPDMSLRDALSLMLTEGSTELEVRGDDGGVRGYLTLEAVSRMLGEGRDEAGDERARRSAAGPERRARDPELRARRRLHPQQRQVLPALVPRQLPAALPAARRRAPEDDGDRDRHRLRHRVRRGADRPSPPPLRAAVRERRVALLHDPVDRVLPDHGADHRDRLDEHRDRARLLHAPDPVPQHPDRAAGGARPRSRRQPRAWA